MHASGKTQIYRGNEEWSWHPKIPKTSLTTVHTQREGVTNQSILSASAGSLLKKFMGTDGMPLRKRGCRSM